MFQANAAWSEGKSVQRRRLARAAYNLAAEAGLGPLPCLGAGAASQGSQVNKPPEISGQYLGMLDT